MNKRIPTHILRDDCIRLITNKWQPGTFIEMGPGTGVTTKLFLERGFQGACFDSSVTARETLKANLASYDSKIEILDDDSQIKTGGFDYLFAFDVIEHIEADVAVVQQWSKFLRPGGRILISVPAHKSKFGKSDELMGHFRRYEKNEVSELLIKAGFQNLNIVSYGFPLINITTPIINILYSVFSRNITGYDSMDKNEKTAKSGISRPRMTDILLFPFNKISMYPFMLLQQLFLKKDFGVEYLAYGTRKG